MRKVLIAAAMVLLVASTATAQVRTQLGGTGKNNAGTDNALLAGAAGGNAYTEEVPSGTCDGSSFLRYNTGAADGSRMSCVAGSGATAWDSIADPSTGADILFAETAQTMTWDSAATAAAYSGITFRANHDSTTDASTQTLFTIGRTATAGTQTFETLLALENLDTDGPVTSGILFNVAAGALTTAIDATDPEIVTALAIGANQITTSGGTITQAELDILQDGLISLSTEITGSAADANVDNNITIDQTTAGTFNMDQDAPGTSEGRLAWDATNNRILVGEAGGALTFYKQIVDEDAGASLLYDGADTSFTTVNAPASCDGTQIAFNGYTMLKAATADAPHKFTCSGSTITLGLAPKSGDHVQATYYY